jgi:hypothetical protein
MGSIISFSNNKNNSISSVDVELLIMNVDTEWVFVDDGVPVINADNDWVL